MTQSKKRWVLDKFTDLLIVILGITIAFQLGKITETEKTKKQEKYIYKELLADLKDDEEDLEDLIKRQKKKKDRLEELSSIVLEGGLTNATVFELHQLLNNVAQFSSTNTTYKMIVANGQLPMIKKNKQRKALFEYYENDQSYVFYEEIEWERVEALNEMVMENYLFIGQNEPPEIVNTIVFKNIVTMNYFNLKLKVEEYENHLKMNKKLQKALD
ncbi:MAG: DUF6090 family protein [Schleiferiaceae bacterium]|nr:DUF6090 family protein [Schleiferiaceae bacterium]